MECRRWVRGPDTYHPEIDCACEECVTAERRIELIDKLELALRRPIVRLLDSGVMPNEIVAMVRARMPKRSRAWMLTRVELTHQAGYWLSVPAWADQLAEVDQLAKHTGFKVGLTISGWLHDWTMKRGCLEDHVLSDSVTDVRDVLAPELAASAAYARLQDGAWDLVADMDFDPPVPVLDAIRAHTERVELGYGPFAADLAPAYADWQERRPGWRPDTEQIHPFTSALHALEVALWNTTDPGDGVVVFTPIRYPFLDATANSGRRRIEVTLITDGWKLDVERFEVAIDDTTKIILFCNPHNPTGRIFDDDGIAAVADVAERHDLLVITDEIWGDLVHQAGFVPLAIRDERFAGRLVTLGSASKTFNLAGLVAHIDHPPLTATLATVPGRSHGSPSTLGITGTIAAWTAREDWLAAVRRTIEVCRSQLATRLAADLPRVGCQPPQAAYLGWLDFSAYDIGDDPSEWLLEHAQVALSSGAKFGTGGLGCARINVATSPEILDRVIARIATALTTHQPNHSGSTA